jgi:hypothetical protein
MAYCPNCNQVVSIVAETSESYEEVRVQTDRYVTHKGMDHLIGHDEGFQPVATSYTVPRCSNCYSELEFPSATSAEMYNAIITEAFDKMKRTRIQQLQETVRRSSVTRQADELTTMAALRRMFSGKGSRSETFIDVIVGFTTLWAGIIGIVLLFFSVTRVVGLIALSVIVCTALLWTIYDNNLQKKTTNENTKFLANQRKDAESELYRLQKLRFTTKDYTRLKSGKI